MKNRDILKLWHGLSKLHDKKNTKLSFSILRNKKLIKDIVESLKTVQLQPVEGQTEFEKDRLALCEKHAAKDEAGNAVKITENGQLAYKIEHTHEFSRELLDLFNIHKIYRSNLEKKQEEFEKILDEEVSVNLIKININDLPDDLTELEISSIEEILYET